MNLRTIRPFFLGALVLVLLATPVLGGCGGGGERNTLVLGWLADQTGASSKAFQEVQKGMDDYFTEMEAADPIPGVKIGFETYDTRLEYARAPLGYEWLMGKGMSLLLHYDPPEQNALANKQAEDEMPSLCFCADVHTLKSDWIYAYSVDYVSEGKAIVDYLVKDWWETRGMTRPIKIGALVMGDMQSGGQYWSGLQAGSAANPGKCELKKQESLRSQTAWASEVNALKDRDAIVFTTVGPASATFLKEVREKGYQGQLVGVTISALGFWTLISGTVPKSGLDGMLIPHAWPLWTDDTAYVANMSAMLDKYRQSEAATLKQGTTWESGWSTAHILAEVVRLAEKNVGAENIDKLAMRDALEELSLEIPGFPTISLAGSGGANVLNPNIRMIKYDAAADEWNATGDWFYALLST
jgi:hypothetical protein